MVYLFEKGVIILHCNEGSPAYRFDYEATKKKFSVPYLFVESTEDENAQDVAYDAH